MYFIDKLALRAGNEKGEDEADTVGCCSLRCEHVTLEQPNFIIFDFLGKDSIRYYNRVPVDMQVYKNIRIFKENKNPDDNLFDRVTVSGLIRCSSGFMTKWRSLDDRSEQAFDEPDERPDCEGVPYLQCIDHLPAFVGRRRS